jgi:hypothetical protein
MTRISQLDLTKLGIIPSIKAYRKLIDDNPTDPRRAEAMVKIATLYSTIANPALNIKPDDELAYEWLKKADDAATPSSPVWNTTHLALAHWLPMKDVKESHRLIDEVEAKAAGNLVLLVNVEKARQSVCISAQDFAKAVEHTKRILHLTQNPRQPLTDSERMDLDGLRIASLSFMLHQIEVQAPAADREALLAQLKKGDEVAIDNFIFQKQLRNKEFKIQPEKPPAKPNPANQIVGRLLDYQTKPSPTLPPSSPPPSTPLLRLPYLCSFVATPPRPAKQNP